MRHLTQVLFAIFWKFGGIGLLVLGILDSSFLFAPLGNDLLVVAMTARHHDVLRMLYYAAMSTVGSVLGCLLIDVVVRKAGEEGLEKHLPRRRLEYVRAKVNRNAAWALVVASLAPPPFPFTPFVMAAAALQYPRKKLLTVVAAARMVRFTGLGVLALLFGPSILQWAEKDIVQGFLVGLLVVCTVGSAISVIGWIRRSRRCGDRVAPADCQPERVGGLH
jgi:membrane protein YqaA with SNARE-associated domain